LPQLNSKELNDFFSTLDASRSHTNTQEVEPPRVSSTDIDLRHEEPQMLNSMMVASTLEENLKRHVEQDLTCPGPVAVRRTGLVIIDNEEYEENLLNELVITDSDVFHDARFLLRYTQKNTFDTYGQQA
ncbi:unnamed protein product, partial [Didymodactylos carnosus]